MPNTKNPTEKLKNNLPKAWAKTIAIQFNCSQDNARKVLNGERQNIEIFEAIINLSIIEKKRKEKLLKKIETL